MLLQIVRRKTPCGMNMNPTEEFETKLENARSFIKNLEVVSPDTHRQLVTIIHDPYAWKIGYDHFVAQLINNKHRNLILEFNTLLPDSYKIPAANEATTVALDDVVEFLNDMKIRLDEGLYTLFLDIVSNENAASAAWLKLSDLLCDHPDVLDALGKIVFRKPQEYNTGLRRTSEEIRAMDTARE